MSRRWPADRSRRDNPLAGRYRACWSSGFLIAARLGLVAGVVWVGWNLLDSAAVDDHECHRRRYQPENAGERQAAVCRVYGSSLVLNTYLKIALVLCLSLRLGWWRSTSTRPPEYAQSQAARHPDRRRRAGRGRRVRRHALPAPATGAALLPDPVRRQALQPDPCDGTARIPRLAAVPGSRSGRRHDRPERSESRHRRLPDEPSADEIDVVVQNVSLTELTTPPFKAAIGFQKVHYAPGTRQERAEKPTSRRSISCCATGAERVRSRKSARASNCVFPRRPGVRGGPPMIANTAFLAAVTVFLLAGWLAGELTFLAPYKATLFRASRLVDRRRLPVAFFNLCAVYYHVARWLFLRDRAASCCTSIANWAPPMRRIRDLGAGNSNLRQYVRDDRDPRDDDPQREDRSRDASGRARTARRSP